MARARMRQNREPIRQPEATGPVSVGATWRRVDLHLHTPGVKSFTCPNGARLADDAGRAELVTAYVEQLANQKISVCALTDYNGIRTEWFGPIRDEAARRGIAVLPGAELAFSDGNEGLHVLAIFGSDDADGINRAIAALDRNPAKPLFSQDRRHRRIELQTNLVDALSRLREQFDCIIILPHPDQENGICKTYAPRDAARRLVGIDPDAIEHCPRKEQDRLVSTGVIDASWFARRALVEFSDNRSIGEIGTKTLADGTPRATYLKLSSTDVSALRLALRDPATRCAVGAAPEAKHARIASLKVSGSGFLGNLEIIWNDDLNVIIGGRGAGKSAVLETLRYALDLPPYSEESYRRDLVQHALGSGGKVSLTLCRPMGPGKTSMYRVDRVLGEDPRVYELDPERLVSVSPSELLGPAGGPTIFGQREIYAVSTSEEYRLRLLDDLIGEEARQRAADVRVAVEALRANARAVLDAKRHLARREEFLQRLATINHEISVYERHGVAEKLREATSLRADGQALEYAASTLRTAAEGWLESEAQVLRPLEDAARHLRRGISTQKALLEETASLIDRLRANLMDLHERGKRLFTEANEEVEKLGSRWREALRPLDEELNRIKQEVQSEVLDPDRLLRLAAERAALGPLLEQLTVQEHELRRLLEERVGLLDAVQNRRLEEHTLRRKRADAIGEALRGRLRLTVEFKGQKDEYRQRLAALLKGSGVSTEAIQRLAAPEATDGIALARAVRGGAGEVQSRFDITVGMADRLVKWLTDDESRLFELETLIPADTLRLELRVDGEYRPLDRLSVGQRATAVLLLLFTLQGRVLVLDQPEDDLDNRFVYEDIVSILRSQKGTSSTGERRQIIAATHNANIPVLGDAELVLVLEAREGHVHVANRGSIDNARTRQLIKMIMEGGEEAFRRRAEKYGGI